MKIRFWGTRGSIPSPGPSTVRYGGNTSCVEVRLSDGSLIILDAGSGIRPLGASLGRCEGTLLLSHYHWDHIQGFPFFGAAYNPQSAIDVFAPPFGDKGPFELLSGQMEYPYFPAPASDLVGVRSYTLTSCVPFQVGSATVRAAELSHPGLTYGYRIEENGFTFVYMSDDEPDVSSPDILQGIVDLAEGADLLLHDCQYDEAEYSTRHGWGHSTPRQAARIAKAAGVGHLLLFHHDPSHSDEQVEALAEEARRLAAPIKVSIAREGETITSDLRVMGRRAV